ncbi:MAG: DUF1887 family CARF protein [Paraglaciecola sp.]|nr:DUF1887 family CARF protein [Paraglaciecola sp.]
MKVHIQIVTGQSMANLLPLLALQPDIIVLLTSSNMTAKQEVLHSLVSKTPQLKDAKIINFTDLPDSNVRRIQDFGLNVSMQLEEQFPNAEFIYDLTGGSKLMAVALAAVFSDTNYSQVYLNTENNLLEFVEPKDKASEQLSELINAKTYLAANGAIWRHALSEKSEWQDKIQQRRALTFKFATLLANNNQPMENLISQLNKAASQATDRQSKLIAPHQHLNHMPKSCYPLMQEFTTQGLIDWQQTDDTSVYFNSADAVNYLNGGWLEEYFYLVACQVGLKDSHCGVKISDSSIRKSDSHNDLDGLCAFNNRLLITECKTAKFGQNEQKDNDIIYKIDSIASHIGGQFCTRLLLSALPVDRITKDNRAVNVTDRAKSVEVQVLVGKDIIALKEHLMFWKTQGKWQST